MSAKQRVQIVIMGVKGQISLPKESIYECQFKLHRNL